MLYTSYIEGKGRGLRATEDVEAGATLFVEAPLLCASSPGARHACGICLGDAISFCADCDEGCCAECAPHACLGLDSGEAELRQSVWYRLYVKFISMLIGGMDGDVDWNAFARVPTEVYDGWSRFAASAELFVKPVRRRWGAEAMSGEARRALTPNGFLDFYLLARANAAEVRNRGSAIFRRHALFNHACCPNAVIFGLFDFLGVRPSSASARHHPASIVVLAEQSIPKDEEVCIDYRMTGETSEDLRKRYGFTCSCSDCSVRLVDQ